MTSYALAIVKGAVKNIGVHVSLSVMVFSDCMPRSGIVGSCGNSILFFKDSPYCSPLWLYQFIFPLTMQEGSLSFTFSPAFIVCLMIAILTSVRWYLIYWLFVFLVLSFTNGLSILEINPLSITSFAIISSHSEGCLLILFIVSFAVQKLLNLTKSHLFPLL